MLISRSNAEQIQTLVPVLAGEIDGSCNLVGFVQIPPTKFSGEYDTLSIGQMDLTVECLSFEQDRTKKNLFCLIYPITLNRTGLWNGLPHFIDSSQFGILSAWACPVGNPDFQRTSLGLLEIFSKTKPISQVTKTDNKPLQELDIYLSIKIDFNRLASKLSFIEFDWLKSFFKFCKNNNYTLVPLELEVMSNPSQFKVLAYTDSTSSGIPNIIRVMRVVQSDQTKFSFLFMIRCEDQINVRLHVELSLYRK